jgi:hypothetical protein
MKQIFTAIFLCFIVMGSAMSETMWQHSTGNCPAGSAFPSWTESQLFALGSDGMRGPLICSMGVGCNGKAWNSCNVQPDNNNPYGSGSGPVRPYYDAAYGDSVRTAAGDGKNHVAGIFASQGEIRITSDRAVYYRVYSLTTGVPVYDDSTSIPAGNEIMISLGSLSAGPYMVIAYDPAMNISMGYRAFMQ